MENRQGVVSFFSKALLANFFFFFREYQTKYLHKFQHKITEVLLDAEKGFDKSDEFEANYFDAMVTFLELIFPQKKKNSENFLTLVLEKLSYRKRYLYR